MRSPRERTYSGSTAGTAATTALTLALILLVVGSLLWFGWLEWPGLHWDADLFASALMNVALRDSWTFDSYSQFRISKPTNAYDFHGVLQAWFYAKLLHVRNWQQLTLAMAALNSLTYLVWVWLYQRSLQRWARPAPWLKAACLALVPALLVQIGRAHV